MKKYLGWIVLTLVVVGCLGVLYFFSGNKSNQENIKANVPEVVETDHVRGVIENYKVTLIEYSDFQCPACAAYEPVIEQLLKDFPNELRLVYRHFPLSTLHKNAELAARAAEAVGKQGKYWEMHDKLFETQKDWESNLVGAKEVFVGYAKGLGLNSEAFSTDMDSGEIADRVQNDLNQAKSLGLSGTPSFFVNGKKIDNPRSYDEFNKLIKSEITQN